MPALVSKNTKIGERPYRVTWFNDEMIPYKHYDIDVTEMDDLLNNNRLPQRVSDKIVNYMGREQQKTLRILKLEPSNVPFWSVVNRNFVEVDANAFAYFP